MYIINSSEYDCLKKEISYLKHNAERAEHSQELTDKGNQNRVEEK